MAGPSELSFNEIRNYMILNGGKVTNHALVKYFKRFLTNPLNRDESRAKFKKYVNSLATIKNEQGEKWLVLKSKYCPMKEDETPIELSEASCAEDVIYETMSPGPLSPTTEVFVMSPIADMSGNDEFIEATTPENVSFREPPPYRPPPIVFASPTNENAPDVTQSFLSEQCVSPSPSKMPIRVIDLTEEHYVGADVDDETAPAVPPRRKLSAEKIPPIRRSCVRKPPTFDSADDGEGKENQIVLRNQQTALDNEQKISVKERTQKFNKLASEIHHTRIHYQLSGKKSDRGVDDEDRASVISLDPKAHDWIVRASQGDYHALAKLCSNNPKIVKIKDPATTALHWACKYGNEDLVKMLCGTYRAGPNEKTGYTPLHIAMIFRHESVFNLLVDTYDADPNIRDWSGRKARQYLVSDNTALSPDAFRNFKTKVNKKNSDKDLGFLRIGSLNVRVKKTTEAFSNFLGVGAVSRGSSIQTKSESQQFQPPRNYPYSSNRDQMHKSWGSADNIQSKKMPPPMSGKVKRRPVSGRRQQEYSSSQSHSTPSTPNQFRSVVGIGGLPHSISEHGQTDSDSDTACGFDSSWKDQPMNDTEFM